MTDPSSAPLREQLFDRRSNLERAMASSPGDAHLERLLTEVDAAIERMDKGSYGLCEVCAEPIEPDRLIADPLVRFCIDHMTPRQQRALEQDLELAAQIQTALLPRKTLRTAGWEAAYHYEGAGPISGDYCDLLNAGEDLYFVLGDVSGKGVAASMLMAHLHATFQALAPLHLPLAEIMERASRMLCESTLPTYFATLVCGRAGANGEVELSNAGHNPPILARGADIAAVGATGLPLGMFCDERFSVTNARLSPGDTILAYTDGLSEAVNTSGAQYGADRLVRIVERHRLLPPEELVSACVRDWHEFRSGAPQADDVTIMVVRRVGT